MIKAAKLRLSVRSAAVSLAALGLGLFAGPPAAAAQDSPAGPIIVTGEPLSEPQARELATDFVRRTGVAASETPAARWLDPVCPRVLGLAPDGARAAERMIREIATAVGAPVAAETCDSNVVVMFTSDAGAVVREIERREPRRLAELDPVERRALVEGDAPIRWWHTSEERDTAGGNGGIGRTSSAVSTTGMRGNHGRGAGGDLASDVPTSARYSNSFISTFAMRSLLSATVVIDQDAVMGRRLSAVAAYAALVALAEISPRSANPEGSILSLFSSANPPPRLTAQDLGFLQTLYRLPLDRQARYHRGTLVAGMIAATTGQAPVGN